MATFPQARRLSWRLFFVIAVTLLAFLVALFASVHLYLLEDNNPLTLPAYSASMLLRYSYDVAYLSSLAAGVFLCGLLAYAFVERERVVLLGMSVVALIIAFLGFGGLLIRHPLNFLGLFLAYLLLLLGCGLLGRGLAVRLRTRLGARTASLLGACMMTIAALIVNLVAIILHTLLLNPVSHTLYMQGQIGTTPYNLSLIAMAGELLVMLGCIVALLSTLRSSPGAA